MRKTSSFPAHHSWFFQPKTHVNDFRRLLQRSNERYARYRQSLNESLQVRSLELQDEALFENSFEEDLELGEFSPDEMDEGDFAYDIVDDLLKSSSSEEDSDGTISDSEVSIYPFSFSLFRTRKMILSVEQKNSSPSRLILNP